MTATEIAHQQYVVVWRWLVALLAAGVAVAAIPSKTVALALVFGVAVVKAGLVVRNYMHLKSEHLLLYALAAVPVLLFIGLILALLPDIVLSR